MEGQKEVSEAKKVSKHGVSKEGNVVTGIGGNLKTIGAVESGYI